MSGEESDNLVLLYQAYAIVLSIVVLMYENPSVLTREDVAYCGSQLAWLRVRLRDVKE